MAESLLKGKRILAVDDEPDVLTVLQEEIVDACPDCTFEKATTFEEASKLISATPYDVVILDIMGVRGFELLDIAVKKGLKVVMLTAHALSPEALKKSYDMRARAYLPKEKLGEVVPFLEDVFKYDHMTGWRKLMETLGDFFNNTFESDWEKKTGMEWKEFSSKSAL